MGIKEYEFLTETLSDIASLSSEYESEKKELDSLQASKNQMETHVGVLRNQLVLAEKSSEDEWRASIEETENEIKEIRSKKKIDYSALDKLKPHHSAVDTLSSRGWMRAASHLGMVCGFTLLIMVIPLIPGVINEENAHFNCVSVEESVFPTSVLNGEEDCSDGSDEWGDPEVTQETRPASPTDAEIHLLDVIPEYERVDGLMVQSIYSIICISPFVWFVFILPSILISDRFISGRLPMFLSAYPEKFLEIYASLESKISTAESEIAERDVQILNIERNLRHINNNPEKIDKGSYGLLELENRVNNQMKVTGDLHSVIEGKWDSVRHLIPYSEMLG
jgi:phage shock protein A